MRLILICCLICLGAPLAAQTQNWQAAMDASSARLRLFALMSARPDGAAPAVAALQRSLGLRHHAGVGPQYVQHSLSVGPVLSYDNNINGGTPGETILIGSFLFNITPESQAKQGVVAGLRAGGNLRFSLSPGTVIEASLSASQSRAVDYDLDVISQNAALCLSQFLGGTNWLDICEGRSKSQRALSQTDDQFTTIGLTRQFGTNFALYETRGKLRQTRKETYDKVSLEMGLTMARGQIGVLDMGVEFGAYVPGQHTRLFGANLALTRPLWGKKTTFFASYGREAGADFFGDPRYDEVWSLGVSRPLIGRFGVALSARDRRSTLANYDGVTFGLDFTFRDITF